MMAGGSVGRGNAGAAGKFSQHCMINREAAFREKSDLDKQAWGGDQRMRAGMDFAKRRGAQIVRRKAEHWRLRQLGFFSPCHARPRVIDESVRAIVHCGTSANAPQGDAGLN